MTAPASAPAREATRDGAGEQRPERREGEEGTKAWGRAERDSRDPEVITPRRPAPEPAPVAAAPAAAAPVAQPAGAPKPAPAPAPAETTPVPNAIDDPWGKVLAAAGPNRRLRILLNDITLVGVENDVVVLAVSEALAGAARANEKELCGLLASAWDRAVKLELRQQGAPGTAGGATAPGGALAPAETQQAINANLQAVQEHPLVKQAMELFGAKVTSVQARKATKQES